MHTKLWIGYEVFSHLNKDAYFFFYSFSLCSQMSFVALDLVVSLT